MPRFDLRVRLSDYVWLSIAVLFAVMALAGLYSWAGDAVRRSFTISELFWVFMGLAALVGSAGLLIVISWRRTCWGAPPGSPRERRDHPGRE